MYLRNGRLHRCEEVGKHNARNASWRALSFRLMIISRNDCYVCNNISGVPYVCNHQINSATSRGCAVLKLTYCNGTSSRCPRPDQQCYIVGLIGEKDVWSPDTFAKLPQPWSLPLLAFEWSAVLHQAALFVCSNQLSNCFKKLRRYFLPVRAERRVDIW